MSVVYAGSTTPVTFAVNGNGTSAGTVVVTAPDGTHPAPPALTTSDGGVTFTAVLAVPTAGVWTVVATVTGAGAGTFRQTVAVTPSAAGSPRSYATTTELASYIDEEPPEDAARLLGRATVLLDRMLASSIYPVNSAGKPTDAVHIAAMRDAACELVWWWMQTGDPDGVRELFTSGGIGTITLGHAVTRGPGTPKQGGASRIPPHVITILVNAGLFTSAPWYF